MALPEGLTLSQSSLQDFVDCPRRFQLRHLQQRQWPAPESADALEAEHRMRLGQALHRLMRQAFSGVELSGLEASVADDPELSRWFSNFQSSSPPCLPAELREPEVTLSAELAGRRVEARYDLLAATPDARWVIVDWKTSRRRNRRSWLRERMQTRIYPLMLVLAGEPLNNGSPIPPEHVEMLYWFAEFPEQSERFAYDAQQLSSEQRALIGLIEQIKALPDDGFHKTSRRGLCKYCVYRSLCWDDVSAGVLADVEEESELVGDEDFDIETIVPIPY